MTDVPELPPGWRLDPDAAQVHADRGIWYVITDADIRTAWQGDREMNCPSCEGDRKEMEVCATCAGRGIVDSVPYCERPWDEIIPGLWLGGNQCQFGHPDAPGGNALPGSRFDTVFSLAHDPDYNPSQGTLHYTYRIADAELDPDVHSDLDVLAEQVELEVKSGRKVLVRCQAGINRSAMIVALVLIRNGWTTDEAITHMRSVRSPFVLFNESFANYVRAVEERML